MQIFPDNKNDLIDRLNKRDESALSGIYRTFYSDFFHLVSKMVEGSKLDAEDLMHDIFISIWNNRKRQFDSMPGFKSYVYICVRNRVKDWAARNDRMNTYLRQLDHEDFFTVQVAENEVVALINQSIELLPEECAKVFRLHIDGWEIKEIAEKLGRPDSTVYKQKKRAVAILKEKLSPDKFLIIFTLLP